jgi:hypothetical protein
VVYMCVGGGQWKRYTCVLKGVDIASVSTIFLLDFGNVLAKWCFLFFIVIQ